MKLDFSAFEILTFDCYGTLIDWEAGIANALTVFQNEYGIAETSESLLSMYAVVESEVEGRSFQIYCDVLRDVMIELSRRLGVELRAEHETALADSLKDWPPFPDSHDALVRLKERFQLVILSNVDDDLFAHSQRHLGVEFDNVITAQQVGAYKPSHRNFEFALDKLGQPKEKILHVAQSLFHDIVPANALEISNVWVNRRGDKVGFGATPASTATPDLEVASMAELAELVYQRP